MRGFTLIEMIGAVVILSIIILIAVPAVINTVNNAKEKAYLEQIKTIEEAARIWGGENIDLLPEEGKSITIFLGGLKTENLIKESYINQKTDKEFPNDLAIVITLKNNNYEYKVIEDSGVGVEYFNNFPFFVLNGEFEETIEVGSEYDPHPKYSSEFYTTTILENDIEMPNVLTNFITEYEVRYSIQSIREVVIKKIINVVDTTPPVLNLQNITKIGISEASNFDYMQFVTATDNSSDTVNVTYTGTISTTPGNYNLVYTATDSSGNITVKNRTIIVSSDL